nr:uncharacterized protein LOC128697276 [Cherax quadricarinatus]
MEKVKIITGEIPPVTLTIDYLRGMSESVKRLVEAGLVFGVQQDRDDLRYSRITLQDGQLYLHVLQHQPPPTHAHTIQVLYYTTTLTVPPHSPGTLLHYHSYCTTTLTRYFITLPFLLCHHTLQVFYFTTTLTVPPHSPGTLLDYHSYCTTTLSRYFITLPLLLYHHTLQVLYYTTTLTVPPHSPNYCTSTYPLKPTLSTTVPAHTHLHPHSPHYCTSTYPPTTTLSTMVPAPSHLHPRSPHTTLPASTHLHLHSPLLWSQELH